MSRWPDETETCKRVIEHLLEAEPFVPFEIEISSGTVFTIRSEDQCQFSYLTTPVINLGDGKKSYLLQIVRVTALGAGTE